MRWGSTRVVVGRAVEGYLLFAVGGAHQHVSGPGQEEQEPSVRRTHVDQSDTLGCVIRGEDDVDPARPVDDLLRLGVLEFAQFVGERSATEEDGLGLDREGVSGQDVSDHCPNDLFAPPISKELDHFAVVGDGCAFASSCLRDRQIRPCIVVLALVENWAVFDVAVGQLREFPSSPAGCHDV